MCRVQHIRRRWNSAVTLASAVVLSLGCLDPQPSYKADLVEADRLAWLTDWYSAHAIYTRAEKAATKAGDRRAALHAKVGRLRGEMQTRALPELSESLGKDLQHPLAKEDDELRLRILTVKGDVDLEWDIDAAYVDWSEVQDLAKALGHAGWENRARGELGMIAFMRGDTGAAGKLVENALQTAGKLVDVGGQLRYLGAIANGLLNAGYPRPALQFAEKALAFARQHPETGFPFVVCSTIVMTHLRLDQADEAERLVTAALGEARTGDRRIKQIELLLMSAKIAQRRGQHDRALEHQQEAVRLARVGRVRRLLADAEHDLAEAYRRRGDLSRAERHARAAVTETQAAGNRFNLPRRLQALATIHAARGNVAEAERLYLHASDVIEGIMSNVPTSTAQARLVGVMSDVYLRHFLLVAEGRRPSKAFAVLERARGRALADVLRSAPDRAAQTSPEFVRRNRTISRLQLQLMKEGRPGARQALLEQIANAEHELSGSGQFEQRPFRAARLALADVQRTLRSDEVILEYVVAEPTSYCLAITRSTVTLRRLERQDTLNNLIDAYVSSVRSQQRSSGPNAAEALYHAAVEPLALAPAMTRVIVVPDGHLHLVPFDQLFADSARDVAVSIAPSASVFALLRSTTANSAPAKPLLALGGVPYEQISPSATRAAGPTGLYDVLAPPKLSALPASRTELEAAAAALGGESILLTGDRANESNLKAQDLGSFRVLHFAVHGVADRQYPERAALILLGDASTGEDGLLQPREISRFGLRASVVVLSACETAVGPTIGQEGVQNLARAFILAGARSVITTLWRVSDRTSTALMKEFYSSIAAGHDVARALVTAKRATVQRFGPDAISTVAAFQLVGVGDARLDRVPSANTR